MVHDFCLKGTPTQRQPRSPSRRATSASAPRSHNLCRTLSPPPLDSFVAVPLFAGRHPWLEQAQAGTREFHDDFLRHFRPHFANQTTNQPELHASGERTRPERSGFQIPSTIRYSEKLKVAESASKPSQELDKPLINNE